MKKDIRHTVQNLATVWENLRESGEILESVRRNLARKIVRLARGRGAARGHKALAIAGLISEIVVSFSHSATVDPIEGARFLDMCPRRLGRKILRRETRFSYVADSKTVATLTGFLAMQLRKAIHIRKGAPRIRVAALKAKKAK